MRATLILNLGAHDLADASQHQLSRIRDVAEQLLGQPGIEWSRLAFPLLNKYLAYINLHKLTLSELVLVGTDQPPAAKPEHRAKDTAPLAHVIKRWMEETAPDVVVHIWPYCANPSDWDESYAFFLRNLDGFAEPDIRYLAGTTGGTPQLNSALLLAGLDCLPDFLPLSVKEDRPQPLAIGLGRRLRQRDVVNAVASHLRHRDFHAAFSLLREKENDDVPPDGRIRRFCLALLRYADYRSSFRFQEAAQAISDALVDAPDDEAREVASRLLDQAAALERADLAPGDPAAVGDDSLRLREMALLAEHYRMRGLLLELPALVYTFSDNALRLLAARLGVHLAEQEDGKGWRRLDPAWVSSQPGLQAHLAKEGLEWRREFNTGVALAVVGWFAQRGDPDAQVVFKELDALTGVRRLRHQGPLGHGTVGVSERQIKNAYKDKAPADERGSHGVVAALRRAALRLSPGPAESPFDLVGDQVLRLIRPERRRTGERD